MRKRTSIVWTKFTDEEFINLIKRSSSYKELLSVFHLVNKGNNDRTIKKRINELNINTDHFNKNYDRMIYLNTLKRTTLKEVCIENSTYSTKNLKRKLLKEGVLENK